MATERSCIYPVLPGQCPGKGYSLVSKKAFVDAPITGEDLEWKKVEGGDTPTPSDVNWGDIGGTLADQTDLKEALDSKADSTDLDTLEDTVSNIQETVAIIDSTETLVFTLQDDTTVTLKVVTGV